MNPLRSFPYGAAALCLLLLSLASGAYMLARARPSKSDADLLGVQQAQPRHVQPNCRL
jgi:hypothetical protein